MVFFVLIPLSVWIWPPEAPGNEEITALLLWFLAGGLFLLFLWRDRQWRYLLRHKRIITRQAGDASQDLHRSYIYIGEVNRKIDLLERAITLSLAPSGREKSLENLVEAAKTLTGSKKCRLLIIDRDGRVGFFGDREKVSTEDLARLRKQRRSVYLALADWHAFAAPAEREGRRSFVLVSDEVEGEDDTMLRIIAGAALLIDRD